MTNLAPANGEITLYAQWKVPVYYAWLDKDGPGGAVIPPTELATLPSTEFVRCGTAYTAFKVNYTSDEYTFHGWYTDQEFNHPYVDGTVLAEPMHLYGKWTYEAKEFSVGYQFVAEDGNTVLPQEVLDQLPAAQTVKHGDSVKIPTNLVLKDVQTAEGIWEFVDWDKTEIQNVEADAMFTGTWKFAKHASVVNAVPEIQVADKKITAGDAFNPLKDVTATDLEEGDLTSKIEVIKNTVDSTKVGVYTVTYRVTDKDGASVTKSITVTINEKPVVPTPAPITPSKPTPTPDTPSEPAAAPTNTPAPTSVPANTPATGDNGYLMELAWLCIASMVGLGCTFLLGKKR